MITLGQRRPVGVAGQQFLLPRSEIKRFSPRRRDTYIQNAIVRILDRVANGVTVSEVSSATGFSRPTVSKHLDILVATGEAYKNERGNLSIFYKNGKVVHEEESQSISTPDKVYTFYILQNGDGRFLYIQEKEMDEHRSVTVRGGITISMKDLPSVMKRIEELHK